VFENKVLRKITGPKKNEVSNLGHYKTRIFIAYRSPTTARIMKSSRL
jgi:hypothetical protein